MSAPRLRYRTAILTLDGIKGPSYNNNLGIKFHSVPTGRPEYSTTQRKHGTTAFIWSSEKIVEGDRDTIYTFYNTSINNGEYFFSIIDHKQRLLFDTSWDGWSERWSNFRGCTFNVQYNLDSPFQWTPQIYGAYLFEANNFKDYL
ncbi:unnamed protein product, partial [marine sediment metagenome]